MILTVNGEYSRVKFCRYYKKQQILRITNPRTLICKDIHCAVCYMLEWRIQDFRRGGASPHGGRRDTNLLNVLENCMKSRKIWQLGGGGAGGIPPRSANVLCSENFYYVVVVILSEGIDVCKVILKQYH